MCETLRRDVCAMNLELPRQGLVTWTSGNVSGRDAETGYIVIKPSGVRYDDLAPDNMVVVDLDGNVVEGPLKPSVDTTTHVYVYRHRPDVGGMVHTHSPYATSFAMLGQSIPVYLTAMGDEFGTEIPLGDYCQIGGEQIGQEIVRTIGASPSILIKSHGVFTIGKNPEAAVKAAVMTEDVAKTVHLALQRGTPQPLPSDEVARLRQAYLQNYGQRSD
ncbi:MAG TPA: L-ribulose-5-phosphate 4-epimerase [Chloroflexota bacterium]